VIRRAQDKKSGSVKVTFALPIEATNGGVVSVVGDFNNWTPGKNTLVKRANGTRSTTVALPPGTVTRFRYLGEGGHWFDDHDADRIDEHGSVIQL
jgi:1,4-alpha-glucan branching enzyme